MSQVETDDSYPFNFDDDKVLDNVDSPRKIGNRIIKRLGLASQVTEAIGKPTKNTNSCML